ncbi:hypothetical protein BN2475_160030 [Paraburkholderia ribeironis]|uniref:Uncharacterized protein n=1 Tax=Paraburkholderia ribeironis TaxID=1247936 RepID=A0A1N7RU56_9BURK|nr:hypothetical protein BN2475_160030 [Paraburkholderia ribeironis]
MPPHEAEHPVKAGFAVLAVDGDPSPSTSHVTDLARLVTIEVASGHSITPSNDRGTYLKPGTRLDVPAYEAEQLVASGHAVRVTGTSATLPAASVTIA